MISKYSKAIWNQIEFLATVFGRGFIILFRKRKTIVLLKLNYATEHLFEQSFLVINYRFRNALWYSFGTHRTLEKQIKIFNLTNFEHEFLLTVHGFFQTKTFHIQLAPELILDNSGFITKFNNLSPEFIRRESPVVMVTELEIKLTEIKTDIKIPKMSINKIRVQNNTYNQNDFI